ncbi:MAG TPA: DUF4347 domain-containing protein, partial [Allocoleopsis sp.]
VYLGNCCLNLEAIERYAWDLQSWFPALSPQDSLLLYGCNVAAGEVGNEFITRLHHLTGANIAASNTLTGNAALGGNWALEVQVGEIAPTLALQSRTMAAYPHVLANAMRITNRADVRIMNSGSLNGPPFAFGMRMMINGMSRNPNNPNQNYVYIAGKGANGWRLLYDLVNSQFLFYVGGDPEINGTWDEYTMGESVALSPSLFLKGSQWVNIEVQYDGVTTSLIVDGTVRAAINTTQPYVNDYDISIAGANGWFVGLTDAWIDDVWVKQGGTFAAQFDFETYVPDFPTDSYFNIGGVADLTGNNRNILFFNSDVSLIALNQAPTDMSLSNVTISENSPNGTVVGWLSTTDPDSGESFSYTLLNDAGGRFIVSGNQIYVLNSSLLNYEGNSN